MTTPLEIPNQGTKIRKNQHNYRKAAIDTNWVHAELTSTRVSPLDS